MKQLLIFATKRPYPTHSKIAIFGLEARNKNAIRPQNKNLRLVVKKLNPPHFTKRKPSELHHSKKSKSL